MRIVLFYLLFTVTAQAANYYVCDTGNDVTGDGSYANPWGTYEKAVTTLNSGSAGDNVYLCKGGVFDMGSPPILRTACTIDNQCVLGSYEIAGSGETERPIVNSPEDPDTILDVYYGARYITVRGLNFIDEWEDVSNADWGILIYQNAQHITIDDMRFEGFHVGVHISGSSSEETKNQYLTIKNSVFWNIRSVGILGGAKYYSIVDNYFHANGRNGGGRPIYLGGDSEQYTIPGHVTDILVSGNILENSSPSDIGNGAYNGVWEPGKYGCNRQVIGGHGIFNRLRISNNIVREAKGTALGGCWGISIDEGNSTSNENMQNLIIENNRVEWVGGLAIGCGNCDGAIIRHNLVFQDHSGSVFHIPAKPEDTPTPTEAAELYGNTAVVDLPSTAGITGFYLIGEVSDIVADVHDNLIVFNDASHVNTKCAKIETGSTFLNNYCFEVNESGDLVVFNEVEIQ